MAKRALTPLMPQPGGNYLVVYEDGSWAEFDPRYNLVNQDDSPNPLRAAAVRTDDNPALEQLKKDAAAEDARRFEANLASQNAQINNQYKLGMMNARTQQEQLQVTREYQQAQTELAKQRLAFDERVSTRDFGQRQSEFNTNTGLKQAELGYGLINTAAQLRGPDNYFQAAEYARGVSQMPETSTFLSALQNNTRLAGYGAQGGQPDPVTVGSLQAKLNSGGNATTDNNYLAQVGNIAAKGAHQLGAGSLEGLTGTESKLFTSGLDELGYDSSTFLDQYRRSRIGQGIAGRRVA